MAVRISLEFFIHPLNHHSWFKYSLPGAFRTDLDLVGERRLIAGLYPVREIDCLKFIREEFFKDSETGESLPEMWVFKYLILPRRLHLKFALRTAKKNNSRFLQIRNTMDTETASILLRMGPYKPEYNDDNMTDESNTINLEPSTEMRLERNGACSMFLTTRVKTRFRAKGKIYESPECGVQLSHKIRED